MNLSIHIAQTIAAKYDTPVYVYHEAQLRKRAAELISLPLPFGYTPRYALKANPHPEIVALFAQAGLHFDASSAYEAAWLLEQGIAGNNVSLSSQQPAHNLPELLCAGVRYTATSLHQMNLFAQVAGPGSRVGLRVNPGQGSGHSNRTTTGGVSSGFGLWHEYLDKALASAASHRLTIDLLQVHVGSGADPSLWGDVMEGALKIVAQMPDVTTLNIGGGFKIKRRAGEPETNMRRVVEVFAKKLVAFAQQTGRQLHLEVEPGSWLVAHAGTLLAQVVDIVDTGPEGFEFLRVNTGMNDIMRPTLYGAEHDIQVLNASTQHEHYVVIGHNCETGDILTPAPHDPEHIEARRMRKASIGDLVTIADAGAYCASLRAHGYNAYPSAKEIML